MLLFKIFIYNFDYDFFLLDFDYLIFSYYSQLYKIVLFLKNTT
jgi:hypothetical protein